MPNLLSSQAIASAQDTLPRALPSFTFLLGRHLLLGNFAVPTSLSCAASVWLWGRYNAGLKGELAAVPPAPFARVGL